MQFNTQKKKILWHIHWCMPLSYDLLSQIFPLLLYLMECDRLDRLVETELVPYVICVVVDLAQESCTASSEQPVNEDVWKQCCDWGIAAQKDPHTLPRLKSLPAGPLISTCKNLRLKTNMFLRWSTVSTAAFMWYGSLTTQDQFRKKEGKVLALMNFECVEDDLLEHLKDL